MNITNAAKQDLGARLHGLRTKKGWTIHDAAKATGIYLKRIVYHEDGFIDVTESDVLVYCHVYRITPNWLLTGTDDAGQQAIKNTLEGWE